ncbi:MAG: GNAT family N-acetyltransferase [Alloprevotella sp.]|nr:GNAT family N-acetyltransferase [Alloprevotella sp.]
MIVKRYRQEHREVWDNFIEQSRNGTFLLKRGYMEYHASRFLDHSLLIYTDKGTLQFVLPAHEVCEKSLFCSHNGLTYGGFIMGQHSTSLEIGQCFNAVLDYLRTHKFTRWTYKPIPYIYAQAPAQEDLYWIFRNGGRLIKRSLSTAIQLTADNRTTTLRKRGIKKATSHKLTVHLQDESAWEEFWPLLTQTLLERHGVNPTHTLTEIKLLQQRFSHHITLATCYDEDKLLAGCVIYKTSTVAHLQYISANALGRELGALDLLIEQIIEDCRQKGFCFLDFGISTENGGQQLNNGLIFQKEGFGGHGVCYDEYELDICDTL